MGKRFWAAVLGFLLLPASLHAEWVSLSGGLQEQDILFLAVGAQNSSGMYAASDRSVWRLAGKEEDGWKQILSVRGAEAKIRHLFLEKSASDTLYVASDKGVQKTANAGKKWSWVYRGIGGGAKTVYWVHEDPADSSMLWLGTGQGLVRVSKNGGDARRVASFPKIAVYSFWVSESIPGLVLAGASSGVYKSTDAGLNWEKVLFAAEDEADAAEEGKEDALAQFQIEEFRSGPFLPSLAHVPSKDAFFAASARGLFMSKQDAVRWDKMPASAVASADVRHLAASADTLYVATDRGVLQWDPETDAFNDLSSGLPSRDVRALYYEPSSGDLFAASRRGVYRFPKPAFKRPATIESAPQASLWLGRFAHEPTVLQVQQAAIHYAEVHPEKIASWRRGAERKAFVPTLSVGADMGEDQNVDLDRGGTNDPDTFIIGPAERAFDWHMDLRWDLSELVWNNAQTSIDTRSKLMVELRDDILNEVTHLYFERRRLQADLALAPPKELPLQIEKELKLQELTADIDALTGGYLSLRLGEREHAARG